MCFYKLCLTGSDEHSVNKVVPIHWALFSPTIREDAKAQRRRKGKPYFFAPSLRLCGEMELVRFDPVLPFTIQAVGIIFFVFFADGFIAVVELGARYVKILATEVDGTCPVL